MAVIGYARVSTDHQCLEAQHDALTTAGCERIFTDKLSGAREDRPGLAALLDYVRAGDTVTVVALDRLGRALSAVIRTIERLTDDQVLLRSLREGIDYSTPGGCSPASSPPSPSTNANSSTNAPPPPEQPPGCAGATPAGLTPVQTRQVRSLRTGGESINELVRTFDVSRATI